MNEHFSNCTVWTICPKNRWRKDRLNMPCLFIWSSKMKNGLQQAVHFGGHCHHTIHYIGVPVGHHALSKSGYSPFSPNTTRQEPCVLWLTYFRWSLQDLPFQCDILENIELSWSFWVMWYDSENNRTLQFVKSQRHAVWILLTNAFHQM